MTATRARPLTLPKSLRTLADLHRQLGGVPLDRIRLSPITGLTAVEQFHARPAKPICELIDGVVVEKAMGARESLLALYIGSLLSVVVRRRNLGAVLGADGMIRLGPGTVRVPDVCFIPWSAFPEKKLPEEPSWPVVPALIIEVRSPSNTDGEIDRKLREFFAKGTQLAWVIDPVARTAMEYTTADNGTNVTVLKGRKLIPGFTLPLADLFAQDRFAG